MREWLEPAVAALLVVGLVPPALGQATPRSSANQGVTSMDQIDMGAAQPVHLLFAPPEHAEDRTPFVNDARYGAQLRSFYFNQDRFNNTRSEAWTLGGSFAVRSGYLADLLRVGAVAYTSQRLRGPEDRDGTQLLRPGQQSYTVLGQLYAEVRLAERTFGAIGRKEYSTPYANGFDSRMSPNTFEGASLFGSTDGKDGAPEWRYGAGYLTKIKLRNSVDFVWMSSATGASVNRGLYVAGVNYAHRGFSIGTSYYRSPDIIGISYSEAKHTLPLGGGRELTLGAQFARQKSAGDDLLTGSAFATRQWGVKSDLDLGAPLLTLAYTGTASGANMRNPWSSNPGFTDAQVETFNRAREKALLLRAEYEFAVHGVPGLSAYAMFVRGSGVKRPSYNENELNLNVEWAPANEAPRGTSIRLRYANVRQRGGGDPHINEFRLIMNYDFQ